jgi:hypothetical protein
MQSSAHSLTGSVQDDIAGRLGSVGQKHLIDALGYQNSMSRRLWRQAVCLAFTVTMGHEVH